MNCLSVFENIVDCISLCSCFLGLEGGNSDILKQKLNTYFYFPPTSDESDYILQRWTVLLAHL